MFTSDRFQIFRPDRGFLSLAVEFVPGTARVSDTSLVWLRDPVMASRFRRQHVDEFLADTSHGFDVSGTGVVPAPMCQCCGYSERSSWYLAAVVQHPRPEQRVYRCVRHAERNPCAVEGCEKTRQAKGHFSDTAFLCRDHWRQVCPPRSRERAVVNRLFRLARKRGYERTAVWPDDLEQRYWRVWRTLIFRARNEAAGDIDMAEINKFMGWEE